MRLLTPWPMAVVLVLGGVPLHAGEKPRPKDAASFDKAVAPLLVRRCLDCHSGARPKGGLDLTRRATTLEGGNKGPAVVPGKPAEGLLWQHVREGRMPPKKPLPAEEKAVIRAW